MPPQGAARARSAPRVQAAAQASGRAGGASGAGAGAGAGAAAAGPAAAVAAVGIGAAKAVKGAATTGASAATATAEAAAGSSPGDRPVPTARPSSGAGGSPGSASTSRPEAAPAPKHPGRGKGAPGGQLSEPNAPTASSRSTPPACSSGSGVVQCVLLGGGITLAVLAITAGVAVPVVRCPDRRGGDQRASPGLAVTPCGSGSPSPQAGRGRVCVVVAVGTRRCPLWPTDETPAPMPPCLDGLDIVDVDWRAGHRLGAVRDRQRHTLTAIVPVSGPQFVVEPRAEQERLLAGWGDVLGQFAVERGVVTHLAWSDLARPSGMHQHLAWIDSGPRGEENVRPSESYRELLDVATATAVSHDVLVTITVARDRLGRHRAGVRHRG